jgi:hypothetical protein
MAGYRSGKMTDSSNKNMISSIPPISMRYEQGESAQCRDAWSRAYLRM